MMTTKILSFKTAVICICMTGMSVLASCGVHETEGDISALNASSNGELILETAETENETSLADETEVSKDNISVSQGYKLKEPEIKEPEKEKSITDTDMSAADRARLNNLLDEIGKEIEE